MASNAVVARSTQSGLSFLTSRSARSDWAPDAREAEVFANLREATRAALVLPGQLRAFALPVFGAA